MNTLNVSAKYASDISHLTPDNIT